MLTSARKDIQTAVSFLTTRVKTRHRRLEHAKMLLEYLHGTISLQLRMKVDDLRMMGFYVNKAHMIHWDCKGQAGATMNMGASAILTYSWKQKMNTKSSTEKELVSIND